MAFRIKITGHSTNFDPQTGTPTCSVCRKAGSSVCGRCNANTYCSTSCQKGDWEYHRLVCSKYAIVTDYKRPDNTHFRALCKLSFFLRGRTGRCKLPWRETSSVQEAELLGGGRHGHMYLRPHGRASTEQGQASLVLAEDGKC